MSIEVELVHQFSCNQDNYIFATPALKTDCRVCTCKTGQYSIVNYAIYVGSCYLVKSKERNFDEMSRHLYNLACYDERSMRLLAQGRLVYKERYRASQSICFCSCKEELFVCILIKYTALLTSHPQCCSDEKCHNTGRE